MSDKQPMAWPWERAIAGMTQALRVSAATQIDSLSIAILRFMDEGKIVVLDCIGAQSVHLAMKAVARANGEAGQQGKVLLAMPFFEKRQLPDREMGGFSDVTALRFTVSRAPVLVWFNDGEKKNGSSQE